MAVRTAGTRPGTSVEPIGFRQAMGQFASGVTVVTAVHPDGQRAACTVNAFCSLSLEPPLALVCVGRERTIWPAMLGGAGYAVNILSSGQGSIAGACARSGRDGLDGVPVAIGRHGVPLITGAIAHVECEVEQTFDGGDHLVVVGRVTALAIAPGEPLLYFRGRLHPNAG